MKVNTVNCNNDKVTYSAQSGTMSVLDEKNRRWYKISFGDDGSLIITAGESIFVDETDEFVTSNLSITSIAANQLTITRKRGIPHPDWMEKENS